MPLDDLYFDDREPKGDQPVYVISAAAELAGMHPQTIRGYERKGLVKPGRTSGGTRRYSDRDIQRLRMIQHLTQEEGLNLAGVKMVLEMFERMEAMHERAVEAERMVRVLAERLQDDVKAAHDSHKYDLVATGPRDLKLHPTQAKRRPPRRRPLE